jgi:ParB family chromosome partitioning protein
MTRKGGLGRGLDALIQGDESSPTHGISYIPVNHVSPNPRQPRASFDPEALAALTASIREHGILQPIVVSYDDTSERYVLIAGERRWLAAKQAGMDTIPALVREVTDQHRLELALIENIQRSDLNPLEAAEAYRQLSEDFGLSHEEISTRVGKSRAAITNTLRLLKLSPVVQAALVQNRISEGHARALLALPTGQAQSAVLQTILSKDLSVRQTEDLVRKLTGSKPEHAAKAAPSPEINALESRLRARFGTRVNVHQQRKGGSVVIYYYSEEELNSLLDALLGENLE